MVIILVLRFVKPGKEKEFLAKYKSDKPEHAGFMGETLTKVNNSSELPLAMRTLDLTGKRDCITYLNVATWDSVDSFVKTFKPQPDFFEPEFEVGPRQRIVLDEQVLDTAPLG